MATIVIIEHEMQRHIAMPYMVRVFAERWRARGHSVLLHHGARGAPPGDLAVLHVDQTVVPQAYRALLGRYRRVVNGAVFDISKSRFSMQLLRPDAAWGGAVIVKTEANFGGTPERAFSELAARLGLDWRADTGPEIREYPVFASIGDVPPEVWRTPGLVVERFLPERDARGYAVRVWTFIGDRELSSRWVASEPIVKASNMIAREAVTVPDEIRVWRARLGFDFGKFDYLLHDGRWVLLDVNRTPSAPDGQALDPALRARLDYIADGVDALLG